MLNPKPSDYSGVTWGDESISGGAIYMRNATGNRNRSFVVIGSEPRLQLSFKTGNIQHVSTIGLRYLHEQAFEQRINGAKPDASSGTLAEDEIRNGNGYSAFIQDRVTLGKKITISGGIRFESFHYQRDIRRNKFLLNGISQIRDTILIANNHISAFIPGIGLNIQLASETHLFAGAHRGFAPPRIKDAISATGTAYELDAEFSWNYELGIRTSPYSCLDLELTGYVMDFENQIIPVSESSGGSGTGLVNGGSTIHQGIEIGATFRSKEWRPTKYHGEIQLTASHNVSTFSNDKYVTLNDERINIKGNTTPYAPEWYASGSLYLNTPFHLQLSLQLHHTGTQFTDQLNTTKPTADGRIGKIQEYQTIDVGVKYRMEKQGLSVRASVKNMTDERYITSRRPQGIRVGLPRMVFVGLDLQF
jgi:Fe(3+) dicitrate transport protein